MFQSSSVHRIRLESTGEIVKNSSLTNYLGVIRFKTPFQNLTSGELSANFNMDSNQSFVGGSVVAFNDRNITVYFEGKFVTICVCLGRKRILDQIDFLVLMHGVHVDLSRPEFFNRWDIGVTDVVNALFYILKYQTHYHNFDFKDKGGSNCDYRKAAKIFFFYFVKLFLF